jgi:choloylglycine hydrolase
LLLNKILILFFCFFGQLSACTGLKLVAKDQSMVHGRTVEFGVPVVFSTVVIPKGQDFVGTTPQGDGLKYTSKYASVGIIAYDDAAIMDGLNEKGLAVGSFYFPGYAKYTPITRENRSKALSPVEFSNWIITQFATVDEVKAALEDVVIAPTILKAWGTTPPPFHYIVYDAKGDCLVIEPVDGKLVTYVNPIGTITNSPTFDWQITNIRNFINLTPVNVIAVAWDGVTLTPFGQGSGMVGLPGDFTPPSRFVKAASYSATATPSANSPEAVMQAFHILNQFDIPIGTVREGKGSDAHTDSTQFTCVRDPQSLRYYFKTYDDQAIRMIDLKQFDFNGSTIRRAKVDSDATPYTDISSELVPNTNRGK